MLDEYAEVEVTGKTEYAPLPSRRSLFKCKKMDLIANLKNLVEMCYNIKANEQFVSHVNEHVKTLINTVTIHLEGENYELVERPVTPDKSNSQKKSRQVKKQSKQNFEFKNLPFPRKRIHKYTGRIGSKAEMMRQYYKAKIFITNSFSIASTNSSKRPCIMKFQTTQEFQISRGETNVNKMTESSEDIFVTKQGIRNDTFRQRGAFTNFDRQIENQIVKHQMLEDDTINLAQHILFKQFKCVNGLELTNLPPSQFSSMQENFVQILHVFENHWITIYGLKELKEIRVYDSLNYTKDKKYPKKTIKSFAKMINSTSSQFKVNVMSVQQQPNAIDCGLFAIAFATDLLYGNSPSNVSYEHEKMRQHLFICLQQDSFTLFPRASAEACKTRSFKYNLDVYCTCRDVYFEEDIKKDEGYFMAQCSSCDDWFHKNCLLIPDEIFLDEQTHESRHCVGCK